MKTTTLRGRLLPMLLTLLLALAGAIDAAAKGPAITFASDTHDFGTIHASGGRVSCSYTFTNTGDKPLVITSVSNGGCGCTKPSFPKEPIKPGQSATIKITFDPSGRRGELNRTVKVSSNAPGKARKLKFTGVVVP